MGWAARTGAAAAIRRGRLEVEMQVLGSRIQSVEEFEQMMTRAHPGLRPHLRAALISYLPAHVRAHLDGIPAKAPDALTCYNPGCGRTLSAPVWLEDDAGRKYGFCAPCATLPWPLSAVRVVP